MTPIDVAPAFVVSDSLDAIARNRFRDSIDATERFFDANQDAIADACEQLANRFRVGGRLFVFGTGASASDAQHVSVEFVHPVIVGKRALPAIALTSDAGSITAYERSDDMFAHQLDVLASPRDIALGISAGVLDASTSRGLAQARERGQLVIALVGRNNGNVTEGLQNELTFTIPSDDPLIVQEVQETLYHVLWELVHVFLEHAGAHA